MWYLRRRRNKRKPEAKVVELKTPFVLMRCCPGCGYLITGFEAMHITIDPDCPKCGKHKFSRFVICEKRRVDQ